jgi:serine phosphatase RsbU (regulator of sigma subunit)
MIRSIRFRQPFWPVTLISGIAAGLITVLLGVMYSLTGQWQYLALVGIAGITLLAHGLAWGLARSRHRLELGLWLIAATQILGAVLIPLFLADFWLIGLMLLVVVPLGVGVADQPRRMPLFAIFVLFGAAAMVGVDLLARPDRLTVLTAQPWLLYLAAGWIVLQMVGLAFLLWYLRLRSGASHHVRLDLATQLSLLFTGISALSILVVTGVLINQIQRSQINEVGQNFQAAAEIEAERLGNLLEIQFNNLTGLVRQEGDLVNSIEAASAGHPENRDKLRQFFDQQESRWQQADDSSDFVLQYRSGAAALALTSFRGLNSFHNNIFVTDRAGGLAVAQGQRPNHFYYGEEAWWQTAWNFSQGDIFLGQLEINPETKISSILIAMRVINPKTNAAIGVVASTYQLRAAEQIIGLANTNTTQQVYLLAPDGTIILGPDTQDVGQPAWQSLLEADILPVAKDDLQAAQADWLLGANWQGQAAVIAHSPLNNTSQINLKPIRRLGWRVVVVDTQANALAEVTRSTKIASLVGLLVLAGVILAATVSARVIARPIEALTATAAAINKGNLKLQAEPVGPVEMITLAETFNTLTTSLNALIGNLEEKVQERTAELGKANEEITALNEMLKEENLRMGAELEVTKRLQQMLLPTQTELAQVEGLDLAGYMEPADEVGGDYYDVLQHNAQVKIGMGDVTGHGLESGVVMLMTQMGIRTLLTNNETDITHYLTVLNRTVFDNVQRMQADKSLSLILLDYMPPVNGGPGQVRFSGQHEELIVVRQGGQLELVDTMDLGFPIGLDDDIADFVAEQTIQLQRGDGLVLYTDGITEAENEAGEQYELDRLCAVVSQHWAKSAEDIKAAVIDDVMTFIGTQTVYDDITLLVVKQE